MNSIKWLIEQLYPSIKLDSKQIDELVEKAEEMHKTEIILAYRSVYGKNGKTPNMIALGKIFDKQAEQYYNETYKK